MASNPPPQVPKWIEEYQKRSDIINVVALAYDPDKSDAEVRQALIEFGEKLGQIVGAAGGPQ